MELTTLYQECINRSIAINTPIDEISKSSIIPSVYDDKVLFCESISGEKGYKDDFPTELTLTQLHQTNGNLYVGYKLYTSSICINDINDINTNCQQGRLLLAALALITTTSHKDKTPSEVISLLQELAITMFNDETSNG